NVGGAGVALAPKGVLYYPVDDVMHEIGLDGAELAAVKMPIPAGYASKLDEVPVVVGADDTVFYAVNLMDAQAGLPPGAWSIVAIPAAGAPKVVAQSAPSDLGEILALKIAPNGDLLFSKPDPDSLFKTFAMTPDGQMKWSHAGFV